MPNNDKKGNTLFLVGGGGGSKLGKCKQGMQKVGNKLDMLFQLFRAIGGPNHTMTEYLLLTWCNHKARLNGPMAYCLA